MSGPHVVATEPERTVAVLDGAVYPLRMDRVRMEHLIDQLQPDEIGDALGLLRLFERIGQINRDELQALRRRVEAREESFRTGRRGLRAV